MAREARKATVHGVAKSQTRLRPTFTFISFTEFMSLSFIRHLKKLVFEMYILAVW